MKALGIVRKIDDLGRIVIPKEVRKAQGWKQGHSMEMFMDGNKLVLQAFEDERNKTDAIDRLERIYNENDDKQTKEDVAAIIKFLVGR